MKPVLLFLTCADEKEAEKIVDRLLRKKLIVCAKKNAVSSSFAWKGKMNSSNEVLVIMDSIEELFSEIESEVRKTHSYQTFVLTAVPVTKTTNAVKGWLEHELWKNKN